MDDFPHIVVGTYEEFVLGYKLKNENEVKKLQQTFATHSHQASVRCVAAHKHLMASSGADEYINIYDMIAMEVLTVINYHNSTVTCLEFTPDGSHLVTANQNGDIAIFKCQDWSLAKLWKEAHKHANGVLSTSIHPSGTLLITAGAENVVRFWNLVKGRQAYATNFSKKCSVGNSLNFALWSKTGDFYAVCIGNKIEIYKTETAAVVYEASTKTRMTCATFTKKNLICIGTEDGKIEIHSLIHKKILLSQEAHKARVKSMSSFEVYNSKTDEKKLQNYVLTVESKGSIKIWHLKKKDLSASLDVKWEVDCDCRITCLTAVAPTEIKKENVSETVSSENCIEAEVSKNHNEKNDLALSKLNSKTKKNKSVKQQWTVTSTENVKNSVLEKAAKKLEQSSEIDKKLQKFKKNLKKKKRKYSETDISKDNRQEVNGNKKIFNQSKKRKPNKFENKQKKKKTGKWSIEKS